MAKLVDKNLFLVVPKIVEQPTWGGDYILDAKGWRKKAPFKGLRIGQSYELFSGSRLRADLGSSADQKFTGELGYAAEPDKTVYTGRKDKLVALEGLIKSDPLGILGKAGLRSGGGKMKLLIKFTQACGNSFQLHVKSDIRSRRWRPKPESWYYFRPGLITLGLKPGVKKNEFQQAVEELDEKLRELSAAVQSGLLRMDKAEYARDKLIKLYDPWRYVNLLPVKADEVIDLSEGGLHHSWEDDARRFPLGNVVYELQLDVMDPVSTLRCFDKGKFKADGSLRKLNIKAYFKYLDDDPIYNQPSRHRLKPKIKLNNRAMRVEALMKNRHYRLDRLTLAGAYKSGRSITKGSFHHLFAKAGSFTVKSGEEALTVTAGHSCFIAARTGPYRLEAAGRGKTEILKSYIA